MSCRKNLEEAIQKTSLDLHALMENEVPYLFDTGHWPGRFMAWAMRDDTFRIHLFRFIDLLPTLKNDSLVIRMMREYFGHLEHGPLLLRQGIRRIAAGTTSPHCAANAIRSALHSFAHRFILSEDMQDAGASLAALRKRGFAVSVDLLGEEVLSSGEEKAYCERYRKLLHVLGADAKAWTEIPLLDRDDRGSIPRFDISLKVSSFSSQLDPVDWEGSVEQVKKAVSPLIKLAQEHEASITFDMEHAYHKDITIAIFQAVLDEHPDFQFGGIALQSYLPETKNDLLDLSAWAKNRRTRITIRLVKGAYWEYESIVNRLNGWPVPVFLDKAETDRNFEDLTALLLENTDHVRPAIATHNVRSAAHALAVADSLHLPRESFEFQMIHGMAEPVCSALRAMGCRVRTYSPIGKLIPGMAYLIRRLLENTAPVSILRRSFFDHEPIAELIQRPHPSGNPPPEAQEETVFRNEPSLDFSRAENRQKMRDALALVRNTFGRRYPLLIGSKKVVTEKQIVSRNPAQPGDIVGSVSSADRETAGHAVEEAKSAWTSWKTVPPEERAQYLFRAAALLRSQRFELAALEVYEVGKSWKEADADVAEAIDFLTYYGNEMIRLGVARRPGNYAGEENTDLYTPKGVAVVIAPWNFPLAIPAGMISASLVTGNTVIFKPSGLSPVLGWKLVEAFRLAGLPSGVLQFLPGPGDEVGEYLVSHPGVDLIAFTGSKDVGLMIIKIAGQTPPGQKNIKKVIAEMGGKNAVIIDETADLDEAVKGVLVSAFSFQGQKCSACSRVIVASPVHDDFCARLRDATGSMCIGPPEDPGNTLGPLIDEAALMRIFSYKTHAENEARSILFGNVERNGYFVKPALFVDVDPASRIAQEEIFGPLVAIIRVRDFDEALAVANGVPYALTGGLYSRSPENIRRAKQEFMVGNLYINRKITGALVGRQPFGGFGMSGAGSKAGGPDYLLHFMNSRNICENTVRKGFAPGLHR